MSTAQVIADAAQGAAESARGDKNLDKPTDIEQKDFFWDQFITYISSAILALTFLNISVQFLRGGGVTCFPPISARNIINSESEEVDFAITPGQFEYFNEYCSQSVPKTEYFPIFILAQGFLLVTPQFVWRGVFKGDFISFFAVSAKLERLRDRNTGKYSPSNFDRVGKLEIEYGDKQRIIYGYYLKLFVQGAVCIASILLSATAFIDYSFDFECPSDFTQKNYKESWPLNGTVTCVYTSLRILGLIRFADYVLIILVLALVFYGLIWCLVRHTKELGHEEIATFSFASSLPYSNHIFPDVFKRRQVVSVDEVQRGGVCSYIYESLFTPGIRSDLNFLLMLLFRADPSHGRVFKEVQIENHLQCLLEEDHGKLHLFTNIKLVREIAIEKGTEPKDTSYRSEDYRDAFRCADFKGNPDQKHKLKEDLQKKIGNVTLESVPGIRDRIYGFVKFAFPISQQSSDKSSYFESPTMAMDISFETTGYALTLARAFHNVVSVHFHRFFKNEKNPVRYEFFYTNYVNVHFPDNIFSQVTDNFNEAMEKMVGNIIQKEKQIDFIVVGPIDNRNKIVKVTLAIELLHRKFIAKDAILLTVRPLKIAHRNVTKRFHNYKPLSFFSEEFHTVKVKPEMEKEIGEFVTVGDSEGISLNCGGVPCVFEFLTYKFVSEPGEMR